MWATYEPTSNKPVKQKGWGVLSVDDWGQVSSLLAIFFRTLRTRSWSTSPIGWFIQVPPWPNKAPLRRWSLRSDGAWCVALTVGFFREVDVQMSNPYNLLRQIWNKKRLSKSSSGSQRNGWHHKLCGNGSEYGCVLAASHKGHKTHDFWML